MRHLYLLLFLPALAAGPSRVDAIPRPVVQVAPKPDQPGPPAVKAVEKAPAPKPVPWSVPEDAVAVALLDAQDVPTDDLPFHLWVWSPSADSQDFQAFSHAINLVSNASTIYRPVVRGIVARVDLRAVAPRIDDLERWLRLREELAFDPDFSLLFTQEAIKLLSIDQRQGIISSYRKPVYKAGPDGTWLDTGKRQWVSVSLDKVPKSVPVVRVTPPKLIRAGIERLQHATRSQAPIVSLDYFTSRALSQIQDKDKGKDTVYSTVFRGLYYDLINIPRSKDKGVSDLDALFGYLDIGDGKTPFQTVLDRLRSDERMVTLRSGVTGKRRLTILVYNSKARPSAAAPLLAITSDIRDLDIDLDTDPLLNFVLARANAHEVLWLDSNGTQRGALYNADGKLADEVPFDIALDTTIPDSHGTKRLEPMISCLRCHGANAGYQPVQNDLRDIFKYNPRYLLALGPDDRDRVQGWYLGDSGKAFSRARDDYSGAVGRATGRWEEDALAKGPPPKESAVRLSSARVASIYSRDRFDLVSPADALRRLGQPDPPKGTELAELRKLFPEVELRPGVFVLPDVREEALLAGKSINPFDWAFLRSFMQERVPLAPGQPDPAK